MINGWHKLLLPGMNRPDKAYTSAPAEIELYDLQADPFEKVNLAAQQPAEVKRLQAIQNAAWSASKSPEN